MPLLDDDALERSAVVANRDMNRERGLRGVNGYAKEISLDPLDFLRERAVAGREPTWLDLCCGTGKALCEAADAAAAGGLRVHLVGVDLAGMFGRRAGAPHNPSLVQASLRTWRTERRFDLITCVHGLHYLGDKLELIARAAAWLVDDGLFVANLALENLRCSTGDRGNRLAAAVLRGAGLEYDIRKRRLNCRGRKVVAFPYEYLGADDGVGANYTGQPAVTSHYRRQHDQTKTVKPQ